MLFFQLQHLIFLPIVSYLFVVQTALLSNTLNTGQVSQCSA